MLFLGEQSTNILAFVKHFKGQTFSKNENNAYNVKVQGFFSLSIYIFKGLVICNLSHTSMHQSGHAPLLEQGHIFGQVVSLHLHLVSIFAHQIQLSAQLSHLLLAQLIDAA